MSALTNLLGDGAWLADRHMITTTAPAFLTSAVIDASAEKISFIGCVWHPTVSTGTINIRKIHFRCGALTFNVLSTIRVSLQNVSATAGAPYQPDGTQDQYYDYALGVGLTANAWNTTGNLTADRPVDLSAVSFGTANSRWVAVVFEYATFTAADSFIASTINTAANPYDVLLGGHTLLNTGSWALLNVSIPICMLECDDGTFAFLEGSYPFSAFSSASVASNGAIRAAGMRFKLPVEVKINELWITLNINNATDGYIILYDTDGTTALVTVNVDNDAVSVQGGARAALARFPPVTLSANSYYRLVFVASTTTAANVYYGDVNAAGYMDGLAGGQNFHWTERDSAGTWTQTLTRKPQCGIKLCAVHDGAGGGGSGMIVHPGMSGGTRG